MQSILLWKVQDHFETVFLGPVGVSFCSQGDLVEKPERFQACREAWRSLGWFYSISAMRFWTSVDQNNHGPHSPTVLHHGFFAAADFLQQ